MGSYNYNNSSFTPKSTSITPEIKQFPGRFGRVLKVIYDDSEDEYFIYGRELAIGGVVFSFLGKQTQVFAYRYQSGISSLPVPGEIIEIVAGPTEELSVSTSSTKLYYRSIVNIWNQANNNVYPDIYRAGRNEDSEHQSYPDSKYDSYFINDSVKDLRPYPGDVLIQGRSGQSLRLNTYFSPYNASDQPSPLTILRNSSNYSENSNQEDVNLDDSSIFLSSNHKIPLNLANNKRNSYKIPPISPESYVGKQIILNSDRIILNSRRDNTLISGENSVGINGKQVNIDGESVITLDAKAINLGGNSLILPENLREPAVLGRENKKLMEELLFTLQETSNTLRSLSTEPLQAVSELKVLGSVIAAELTLMREMLEKINSTKVFIDSGR